MRSSSRQLELALQVVRYVVLGIVVLGLGIGFFAGAYFAVRGGKTFVVDFLLWGVFLIWQLGPVLFEGYSPGINFREIARYPVSFRLYFLLNIAYGALDPAALAGLFLILCIWIGLAAVSANAALFAAPAFLAFALLNILCNRLLLGILERFQSSRRGRETLAVVFLLFAILPQLFQFAINSRMTRSTLRFLDPVFSAAVLFNRILPPGAVSQTIFAEGWSKLLSGMLLVTSVVLLYLLLAQQSRAVYEGEMYSESRIERRDLKARPGWNLPLVSGITSAIIEKEFRYTTQSARFIVQLIYPIIFAVAVLNSSSRVYRRIGGSPQANSLWMLVLIGSLLVLNVSNLAYNIFGMEQEGFGRWLMAPLRLQTVIFAKNIMHGILGGAFYFVICGFLLALGRISPIHALTVTLAFMASLVLQFSMGNLFSVHWPKRVELGKMSSRMVSGAAGLVALLAVAPAGLLIGLAWMAGSYWGFFWLPPVAAATLLAANLRLYFYLLDRSSAYIQSHIEEIEDTLTA